MLDWRHNKQADLSQPSRSHEAPPQGRNRGSPLQLFLHPAIEHISIVRRITKRMAHLFDASSKVDLNSRLRVLIACSDANLAPIIFNASRFGFQVFDLSL